MEYRWLEPDEIESLVNPACESRGWAPLNINEAHPTCRVMGAFRDGELVEAFVLQMHLMLGPWIKVDNSFRDDGTAGRELAERAHQFLSEVNARGAFAICQSPASERLARRHGMELVDVPVYQWTGSVPA